MKAFMLTPMVFIILFLIAFSISFHFFSTDKKTAEAVAYEAFVKKKMTDVEKEAAAASSIVFEGIFWFSNQGFAAGEGLIRTALRWYDFNVTNVFFAPLGNRSTLVTVTFSSFRPAFNVSERGVIVSFPISYSFIVAHPYYFFVTYSQQAQNYACNYVNCRCTGNSTHCLTCSGTLNSPNFEQFLENNYNFDWLVASSSVQASCSGTWQQVSYQQRVSYDSVMRDPLNPVMVRSFSFSASAIPCNRQCS